MSIYVDQEGTLNLSSNILTFVLINTCIIFQKSIYDIKFRFDYEIEVPVPNELQRKDILTKQLSEINNNVTEEEIDLIAHRAQGFVGADLLAVVNRAHSEVAIKVENLTYKHLCTALTQVKPSAIKEVLVQVPNVSFFIKLLTLFIYL